jgi:hypothetical protein
MSIRRPRKTGNEITELFLKRTATGAPEVPDALVHVLAAATAQGHPDELAGREQALAAFREAPSSSPTRRKSMLKSLLTLKVGLGVVVATTAGGAAFAATDGGLPRPLHHDGGQHAKAPKLEQKEAGAAPTTAAPGSGVTDPKLAGLCRVLLHKERRHEAGRPSGPKPTGAPTARPTAKMTPQVRPTGTPGVRPTGHPTPDAKAVAALVKAAGGKENVKRFCASLLDPAKPHGSTPTSGPTALPTPMPTEGRTPPPAPTAKPTAAPTGGPVAPRPTDSPGTGPGDKDHDGGR